MLCRAEPGSALRRRATAHARAFSGPQTEPCEVRHSTVAVASAPSRLLLHLQRSRRDRDAASTPGCQQLRRGAHAARRKPAQRSRAGKLGRRRRTRGAAASRGALSGVRRSRARPRRLFGAGQRAGERRRVGSNRPESRESTRESLEEECLRRSTCARRERPSRRAPRHRLARGGSPRCRLLRTAPGAASARARGTHEPPRARFSKARAGGSGAERHNPAARRPMTTRVGVGRYQPPRRDAAELQGQKQRRSRRTRGCSALNAAKGISSAPPRWLLSMAVLQRRSWRACSAGSASHVLRSAASAA